ncbi:hypothetical protein CL635_03365 [bacterium]|nr:hypothetical protein [bacterium]|tara:strand:- start:4854 stop:5987 length:1134 start_codon:yes stop_codon:yes gene_type:complete
MFEGESKFHHIPEDSPEHVEMQRRRSKKESSTFGESSLTLAENKSETAASAKEGDLTAEEREKILEQSLGHEREIFLRLVEAEVEGGNSLKRRKKAANEFLEEAIRDKALQQELSESLGISVEDLSPEQVTEGLRNKQLGVECFQKMLKVHVAEFHRKAEGVESIIEKYREEFLVIARAAVKNGYLPTSEEKLLSRLEGIPSRVFDTLEGAHVAEEEDGAISLNIDIPSEAIRHVVYHELVHAIAGKSIATYQEKEITMTHEQKHGLKLRVEAPGEHIITGRFSWLDEAVTEETALHLLGEREDEVGDYQFERLFLKSMIDAGVPEELFRNAYFEDYDTEADPGQRMPAWHALAKKINEVGREKNIKMKDFSTMFKQ